LDDCRSADNIDSYGNVGDIGGVRYKLIGACHGDADVFIVPDGKNYKEALKVKEKEGYNIEIVGVENFDEALEYLKNYKK
jgi:PDZ domain-containing protein